MNDIIKDLKLDKVIHERSRLLILTLLAKKIDKKLSFNELKELTQLTSGNLSVQIKNLEEAGYITIYKYFKDNKPFTEVMLTEKGQTSLENYLNEIEKIIKLYRKEE